MGTIRIVGTAALVAGSICAGTAPGGVVTHVAQEDSVTEIRTTTVPKPNDPDGDNVYGTAGHVFYTVDVPHAAGEPVFDFADPLTFDNGEFQTLSSLPGYLSLENNGQAYSVGGFPAYQLIDDPGAAPGPAVPDVMSGLALNNFIEIGTEASLVDIVIGAGFPTAGIRVGIMMHGSSEDAMGIARLSQTAGSGGGSATAERVGTPYTYFQFFDITGAAAGDRYTLFLTKAPGGFNPNVAYIGLTFDNLQAVPEPSSLAMLGTAGVAGLGLIRRRRGRAVRSGTSRTRAAA